MPYMHSVHCFPFKPCVICPMHSVHIALCVFKPPSLPALTSIVSPQWHGSCHGSKIMQELRAKQCISCKTMQKLQNNARVEREGGREGHTRWASPSGIVPLYSGSRVLLQRQQQGIMPAPLFTQELYTRIIQEDQAVHGDHATNAATVGGEKEVAGIFRGFFRSDHNDCN